MDVAWLVAAVTVDTEKKFTFLQATAREKQNWQGQKLSMFIQTEP